MSTNTSVFGLFKYDPATDGNLPFNITQALNNNWNKIDSLVLPATAAAAPYNPSGTYSIGDYCIYNGTLQKCNTPIPSGEAWNAEHWAETTVAAELARKVDKTPPQEHEISFRSGWSNAAKSTYYKTQEGSCVVNCAVYGTGVASYNSIATLPAGFRPNATVGCAAHAFKGGIRGIAEAQIAANGDISIYSPIEFDYVSFGATFQAQN